MIIPEKYIDEVIKKYKSKPITSEMIKKDLALSYILHEIKKQKEENENSAFHKLIFKGGTLLAKSHLSYHRISEDLDFTFKSNNELNQLSKKSRESQIKKFIKKELLPELITICKKYDFDFDATEINKEGENKYCPLKYSHYWNRFNIYINPIEINPIKIEINFCDEPFFDIEKANIVHLNPESNHLVYPLENLEIESYGIEEIILEKLRAIIIRENIKERDIYDLFLLSKLGHNIFEINPLSICKKIQQGISYKNDKANSITHVLEIKKRLEEQEKYLEGEIKDMNLIDYDSSEYKIFFHKLKEFILQINLNNL